MLVRRPGSDKHVVKIATLLLSPVAGGENPCAEAATLHRVFLIEWRLVEAAYQPY
jgi:hypothetical protein